MELKRYAMLCYFDCAILLHIILLHISILRVILTFIIHVKYFSNPFLPQVVASCPYILDSKCPRGSVTKLKSHVKIYLPVIGRCVRSFKKIAGLTCSNVGQSMFSR